MYTPFRFKISSGLWASPLPILVSPVIGLANISLFVFLRHRDRIFGLFLCLLFFKVHCLLGGSYRFVIVPPLYINSLLVFIADTLSSA